MTDNVIRQIVFAAAMASTQACLAEVTWEWSADGSTGLLYDDNLTVVVLDIASNEQDYAALFDLSGGVTANLTDKDAIRTSYGFSQSKYFEFSQFDLQLHRTSVEYGHEFGSVRTALAHQYFYANLGGNPLLGMHYLTPSLSWSATKSLFIRSEYKYKDKNLKQSDARDAKTSIGSLRAFYFIPETKSFFTGGVQYESENATADEFDFNAYILKAGYRTPLPLGIDGNRLDFDITYEDRAYKSISPQIGEVRGDEKWTLGLSLKVPVTDVLFVEAGYVYRDYKSNFPGANFTENNVTLEFGFEL